MVSDGQESEVSVFAVSKRCSFSGILKPEHQLAGQAVVSLRRVVRDSGRSDCQDCGTQAGRGTVISSPRRRVSLEIADTTLRAARRRVWRC